MPPPRFRFTVRTMILWVAIVAVLFVVCQQAAPILERRAVYLDRAAIERAQVAISLKNADGDEKAAASCRKAHAEGKPLPPGDTGYVGIGVRDSWAEYSDAFARREALYREEAAQHSRLAERFRRAAWRPWSAVDLDVPPPR